eukprot:TRINITY_DN66385_c0_g1_i2.p1 TRINITY_DN66385_c0_g1~~TRINITY_DN66385_c0_g1_i2.p1  ORF type:complete len:967 (-),score=103.33 TRINITY_DN66385_c0_g1_i2:153-3053(-)
MMRTLIFLLFVTLVYGQTWGRRGLRDGDRNDNDSPRRGDDEANAYEAPDGSCWESGRFFYVKSGGECGPCEDDNDCRTGSRLCDAPKCINLPSRLRTNKRFGKVCRLDSDCKPSLLDRLAKLRENYALYQRETPKLVEEGDELLERKGQLEGQKSALNSTKQSLIGQVSTLSGEVSALRSATDKLQGDNRQLRTTQNTYEQQLTLLKYEIDKATGELRELGDSLAGQVEVFSELTATMASIPSRVSALQAETAALKSQLEDLEVLNLYWTVEYVKTASPEEIIAAAIGYWESISVNIVSTKESTSGNDETRREVTFEVIGSPVTTAEANGASKHERVASKMSIQSSVPALFFGAGTVANVAPELDCSQQAAVLNKLKADKEACCGPTPSLRITSDGFLESYLDGTWGYACPDYWVNTEDQGWTNADVACNEMGFLHASWFEVRDAPTADDGTHPLRKLPKVECRGTENHLYECPSKKQTEKCGFPHSQKAIYLTCSNSPSQNHCVRVQTQDIDSGYVNIKAFYGRNHEGVVVDQVLAYRGSFWKGGAADFIRWCTGDHEGGAIRYLEIQYGDAASKKDIWAGEITISLNGLSGPWNPLHCSAGGCSGGDETHRMTNFIQVLWQNIHPAKHGGADTRCLPTTPCRLDVADEDECALNNGGCAGICTNNPFGTVECSCSPGYTLDADGKGCTDVDECAVNNGGCAPGLVCSNTPGGRVCGCSCSATNDCSTNNGGCSHTCNPVTGGRYCSCPGGMELNPDGVTCDDIATTCIRLTTGSGAAAGPFAMQVYVGGLTSTIARTLFDKYWAAGETGQWCHTGPRGIEFAVVHNSLPDNWAGSIEVSTSGANGPWGPMYCIENCVGGTDNSGETSPMMAVDGAGKVVGATTNCFNKDQCTLIPRAELCPTLPIDANGVWNCIVNTDLDPPARQCDVTCDENYIVLGSFRVVCTTGSTDTWDTTPGVCTGVGA